MGKSSFVFLKDPEYAWIPAKLLRSSGNVADVEIPQYADEQSTICDGGRSAKKTIQAEVDLKQYNRGVLPMQNVDENGKMTVFPDMVELPFLHEVGGWMISIPKTVKKISLTLMMFLLVRLVFFIT